MIKVLSKGGTEELPQYLVQRKGGERMWILEKEVPVELLLEYHQTGNKAQLPHEMISFLLDSIQGLLRELESPKCKLTIAATKRRINLWIGYGNTFLKSRRTIHKITDQVKQAEDMADIISMLKTWVATPNHTFAPEWDHSVS